MNSKSILIVEDEAVVSLDLSILLKDAGYNINRICSSSNQLFDDFCNYPQPDLILMDVHIKGELDGLESSLKIKELYDIPVIFLTAYADKDTIAKAKISYPYGYIIKPYDKRKLLIIVEMGLNIIELEKEVKRREELFSATFNSIADAVIVTDNRNKIKYVNPVAISMVSCIDILNRDFHSVYNIDFNIDQNRGTFSDYSGKEKILDIKKTKLDENLFKEGGYVWILTDVTIPLFLESQLRETQKMEAVGRLAGGIAHDFNNLLTVIMGYCSLILDNTELIKREGGLKSDILGIQHTSQKAVKLTRQLMTFSNNQVRNPQHLNLNEIIKDLSGIFGRLIPDSVRIKYFLSKNETIIHADPVQIEQILINLVVNSRDAIEETGHIDISTSVYSTSNEINHRSGIIPGGEFVLLTISDNGCGIPGEIHSKIFEPFFSTKREGKGIGLGLSTVYGIVQHSGGFIDLKSSPGEGCVFKIYFPLEKDDIPKKFDSPVYKNLDVGTESVLVVEEDEFVRSIMERILAGKGYNVINAANAGEALLICEFENESIDLVISDLYHPRISGIDLISRLKHFRPSLKVLYSTTHTLESIKDENSYDDIEYLIQKPFDPEDFSLLVRKSLDRN